MPHLTEILSEDLNTPAALAYLSSVETDVANGLVATTDLGAFEAMLGAVDDALGLNLMAVADISSDQKQLLQDREQTREDKDWAQSDDLRTTLTEQGIGLRDTAQGTIWFRL